MIKVSRPAPDEHKISTKESFELCYLRHQYFRRAKYNPTEAEMQPYMKIVEHFTKNTFFTYQNLFRAVGMYHEDIVNIGRVHLVSFLGLYALDINPVKKEEFTENTIRYKHRFPTQYDFNDKDKAIFTLFFKQRMEDLVRVCRQKVRNIKGQPSEEFVVFYSNNKPPKHPRRLLKEYEELGFKKVDFSTFKSIRKRSDVNKDATIFQFAGQWYVALTLEQKNLDIEDLICSDSNPYENKHNMQPDDLYVENDIERLSDLFYKKSNLSKRVTLRNFIVKNKNSRHYKKEVTTARKLLRELGG